MSNLHVSQLQPVILHTCSFNFSVSGQYFKIIYLFFFLQGKLVVGCEQGCVTVLQKEGEITLFKASVKKVLIGWASVAVQGVKLPAATPASRRSANLSPACSISSRVPFLGRQEQMDQVF